MKRRWTSIWSYSESIGAASSLTSAMKRKFPEVKFKHGPLKMKSCGMGKVSTASVYALLPTPHPNEISKEVFLYVQKLAV